MHLGPLGLRKLAMCFWLGAQPALTLCARSRRQSQLAADLDQLTVHVLPFARPLVGDELPAAEPAELAGAELALALVQVVPQGEVGQEIRPGVAKAGVEDRGRVPFFRRALTRILNGKTGRDHQHLAQAPEAGGLEHHAPKAGVQRHLGQLTADVGEAPTRRARRRRRVRLSVAAWRFPFSERPQFFEKGDAVFDVAPVRWVHEGKILYLAQTDGRHLQDDRRQVRAQYFGLSERTPGLEVLLRIEPKADAGPEAAAATGALVGRGLRYGFDGEPLDLGAPAVARNARRARVDDVTHTGHGERGFGHIGGKDRPAPDMRLEDPVLFGRGEPAVQWEDLQTGPVGFGPVGFGPVGFSPVGFGPVGFGQGFRRVPHLAFAGEEDENVAGAFGAQLGHRIADRLHFVGGLGIGPVRAPVVVVPVLDHGAVPDLDGISPA